MSSSASTEQDTTTFQTVTIWLQSSTIVSDTTTTTVTTSVPSNAGAKNVDSTLLTQTEAMATTPSQDPNGTPTSVSIPPVPYGGIPKAMNKRNL